MNATKTNWLKAHFGGTMMHLVLVLIDAIIVNLAYFLALVIRFYVNWQFRPVALELYIPAFLKFTPYYTVLCLGVFALFSLYNNGWKHAGLHDLNRIAIANIVTCIIHVCGTVLFVCRMPITYYCIGAILQFVLISAIRFSYRLFVLEQSRLRRLSGAKLNVMIVGVGETARILRSQIESDSSNVAKPVCIFSYRDVPLGKMINGLPVLCGVNKLTEYIEKYRIKCVILADSLMPADVRKQIRDICQKNGVEVQDFSGYLTNDSRNVTLRKLLELACGAVEIKFEGKTQSYQNGEQALMAYSGKYEVKAVYTNENKLGVEITRKTVILNDTNEDWVKDTEKNGEEISFF